MSVALASMDSAYGLSRLAMSGISVHHHLLHLQQLQQQQHLQLQQQQHHHLHQLHQPALDASSSSSSSPASSSSSSPSAALRFSVVNILRPDFGREAIAARPAEAASSGSGSSKTTPIKVTPLPAHSPLALARDLSTLSSRHSQSQSPRPRPSHSPLEPASNLSRSASLESLASSRSSVAGSSVNSSAASTVGAESVSGESTSSQQSLWPAWIYCTRYSDRPSSGPRSRRVKRTQKIKAPSVPDEKRPRTAFSGEQLAKLRDEFAKNKYLNEERRQKLSKDLGLNEQQIKIWFQNKRAKIKKATGQKNPLALQLMAQGLYNHSTVPVDEDGEEELSR